MKKSLIFLIAFALSVIPTLAFASDCTTNGATIIYVNGIETTQQQAEQDTAMLGKKFLEYGGSPDVQIITGYNPTHLGGLGDELESISQAFNLPISDYDLDTILDQIASEVTTKKVLLVGHSQGTFYTNEMYDYLVHNGVPPASLAVYNIATPASYVAGGGAYLTSANDKVINYVRQLDAKAGAPPALSANIIIPDEPGYAANAWGGHYPDVYFDGAPGRIVTDIKNSLAKLAAAATTNSACFTPPAPGLTYDLQKAAFAAADPAVSGIDYAANDARNTVASVMNNANDIIHSALSDAIFSIIPRPTVQNAGSAFAVEKALYGSSMSVADYEALVQGKDIPEVEPDPQTQQQAAPDPQELRAGTASQKSIQALSSTSSVLATTSQTPVPPTPEPLFAGISISPGFGGGNPSAQQTPPIVQTESAPNSSDDVQDIEDASSTQAATTTATTTIPAGSPDEVSASSTPEVASATTAIAVSPVVDSFDTEPSGWSFHPSDYPTNWTTSSWDTNSQDCYAGNCLSETIYDKQYDNIKIGDPLDAGSFVIYFRNDRYYGAFGAGVCTDATSSQCTSGISVGGTSALLFQLINRYRDNTWHYLYFAFRDGDSEKEYCGLVDSDDSSSCSWQTSSVPNGTTYSGVIFYTGNGLDADASFYWDELGTAPRAPSGP